MTDLAPFNLAPLLKNESFDSRENLSKNAFNANDGITYNFIRKTIDFGPTPEDARFCETMLNAWKVTLSTNVSVVRMIVNLLTKCYVLELTPTQSSELFTMFDFPTTAPTQFYQYPTPKIKNLPPINLMPQLAQNAVGTYSVRVGVNIFGQFPNPISGFYFLPHWLMFIKDALNIRALSTLKQAYSKPLVNWDWKDFANITNVPATGTLDPTDFVKEIRHDFQPTATFQITDYVHTPNFLIPMAMQTLTTAVNCRTDATFSDFNVANANSTYKTNLYDEHNSIPSLAVNDSGSCAPITDIIKYQIRPFTASIHNYGESYAVIQNTCVSTHGCQDAIGRIWINNKLLAPQPEHSATFIDLRYRKEQDYKRYLESKFTYNNITYDMLMDHTLVDNNKIYTTIMTTNLKDVGGATPKVMVHTPYKVGSIDINGTKRINFTVLGYNLQLFDISIPGSLINDEVVAIQDAQFVHKNVPYTSVSKLAALKDDVTHALLQQVNCRGRCFPDSPIGWPYWVSFLFIDRIEDIIPENIWVRTKPHTSDPNMVPVTAQSDIDSHLSNSTWSQRIDSGVIPLDQTHWKLLIG